MADTKIQFPSYDDWESPWSKRGEEFDAEKAAKLIYNMTRNAAQAEADHKDAIQVLKTEHGEAIKAKDTELEARATKVRELEDRTASTDAERARLAEERRLADFEKRMDERFEKLMGGGETKQEGGEQKSEPTETDRLRLALKYGLDERTARGLQGSNLEELEADAQDAAGVSDGGGDLGYDDDNGYGEMPSRMPANLRSNLGGSTAGITQRFDPAKLADQMGR